jgi:hypothetical protein
MWKFTVRIGRLVKAGSWAVTFAGGGRGPARARTVNIMLGAAALAAGLTMAACSPADAPVAQGGAGTASPAGQAGQAGGDPGCQAMASQISTISRQLSTASGNYSAQVPVLQAWYKDLQAAQQEAEPRSRRLLGWCP